MFNPWLIIGVIALCAVSFIAGIKVESNSRDADLLVQEKAHHDAYKQALAVNRNIANAVSKNLNHAESKRKQESVQFRAELQRARDKRVPLASCPQAAVSTVEAAEPRFTYDYARLHDLAFGQDGLPATGNTGATDAGASHAGTVDAETVLAVHGENAESWNKCRDTLRGWQALAREQGWVK